MSVAIVKIFINHTGIHDLLEHIRMLLTVCKKVGLQHHIDIVEQLLYHLRIATDRNSLISVVKVIVIISKTQWKPPDNKSRKLLTVPPPLLFRIAFDQLLIDILPDQ